MKKLLIISTFLAFISIAALSQTYTMSSPSPITTCLGSFYDSGGPSTDYPINQNSVLTLYPSTPGAKLSVNFTSFHTAENKDFLYVYNGHDTLAPRIGNLTGQSGYGRITSSAADGSLTFKFTSDNVNYGFGEEAGWIVTRPEKS